MGYGEQFSRGAVAGHEACDPKTVVLSAQAERMRALVVILGHSETGDETIALLDLDLAKQDGTESKRHHSLAAIGPNRACYPFLVVYQFEF